MTTPSPRTDRRCSERVLARHSKSFALAGRLFPPGPREDAAAVYAWCRRCDDGVDLTDPGQQAAALVRAREQLAQLYAGAPTTDPILGAFQEVVRERQIPSCYPQELLDGLAMDVEFRRYETMDDLLLYCYRVAGTVGLMMCHVMGVADGRALRHAAHLGMAMQITNICRDVMEDWERRHIYLPDEVIGAAVARRLWERRGEPLPRELSGEIGSAVQRLLAQAAQLYRSGDAGMRWLSWRCALSVRTARYVYAAIGGVIESRNHDVWAGRAVVSVHTKLLHVAQAMTRGLLEAPSRLLSTTRTRVPSNLLRSSDGVVGE
ncbi:MAG TPA: phytoene/squalene synthase family protein [Vicinamibacteria bacterium]